MADIRWREALSLWLGGEATRATRTQVSESRAGRALLSNLLEWFRHHGIPVEIVDMNEATATMVERLATHDKAGAALVSPAH